MTYKLHFLYTGTPSEYLGQVRISRSWGQGQGHTSVVKIQTFAGVVCLRLKGDLVSFFSKFGLVLVKLQSVVVLNYVS